MSGLPQELIDHIIHHVHDMKNLKACPLVCSNWPFHNRKYLLARPAVLVYPHPSRSIGPVLPRQRSISIRVSFLLHITLRILAWFINPLHCRFPSPVLFRASGIGDSEMAYVYRPFIVDDSFLWLFSRKCDGFNAGACHCPSNNPCDVCQPPPTSQ